MFKYRVGKGQPVIILLQTPIDALSSTSTHRDFSTPLMCNMDSFMYLFGCSFSVNRHCLVVLPPTPQVTVVRQEYEGKIKGLMPAELRQELEDTITSLKAQVRSDCLPGTCQIQAGLERTR